MFITFVFHGNFVVSLTCAFALMATYTITNLQAGNILIHSLTFVGYDTRTNKGYEGPCFGSEEVSLTLKIVNIKLN